MTREEAIKFLYHIADEEQSALEQNCRTYTGTRRLEALSMAISALREQPRLISVEERLPTPLKTVLVCRLVGRKRRTVEEGRLGEDGVWKVYGMRTTRVSHWMPLPEPPEVTASDA